MGTWQKLAAADGTIVPIAPYKAADTTKAVFMMMPALGVQARLYKGMAERLASQGITTILFEQRGHGESPYRPGKGYQAGFRDYLETDIPLVLDWVKQHYPDKPFFIGGHSLGAHFSAMVAAERPDEVAGIVQLACVFPYYRFFETRRAYGLRFLCALLPLLSKFMSYYPGHKFGFGANEYWPLMMDWRDWATCNNYDFGGATGTEARMASYTGPLLSISLEDDRFSSVSALKKPHQTMAGADVTLVHLTEKEQGQYIGHFEWVRRPDGVVKTMIDWIDTCLT
ncbi:MAG: alpha/beta fold hydrolase [Kordiimonadaceae bacterium]|nr:alpha/beta fold hydrolase [Kordiimonadaceae bacterium]